MWSIIERTHIKVSDNYRVNSPLYIHGIVLWLFLPYLKKKTGNILWQSGK